MLWSPRMKEVANALGKWLLAKIWSQATKCQLVSRSIQLILGYKD
uniref:Uncharacterized protein n=1 Tax=Cyanidiaceae sp. MX-AZ01 TaxID=1503164 RepID=A0A060A8J8_9RHOD|nr:hypothetical protein [Cyanidiaceae sp. MX-AZ01]